MNNIKLEFQDETQLSNFIFEVTGNHFLRNQTTDRFVLDLTHKLINHKAHIYGCLDAVKLTLSELAPLFDRYFGRNRWFVGGSAALVMRDVLNRTIGDLDIITFDNFYDLDNSSTWHPDFKVIREYAHESFSHKIAIDDVVVQGFGVTIGQHNANVDMDNQNVDIFHVQADKDSIFKHYDFRDGYLLASVEAVVAMKKKYIENALLEGATMESLTIRKHIDDFVAMKDNMLAKEALAYFSEAKVTELISAAEDIRANAKPVDFPAPGSFDFPAPIDDDLPF